MKTNLVNGLLLLPNELFLYAQQVSPHLDHYQGFQSENSGNIIRQLLTSH